MIDSSSAARLENTDFGWITTVRRDGQPQSSYVWFHFDGTDVFVISEPRSGKVRNITGNPRVSFHLDGDGTEGNSVLTIDGTAELSFGTEEPQRLSQYLTKYEHRIHEDLESTPERYAATFSTAIKIGLMTIRAW
jgi:PPOX class probable F420-dependent enzyme